MKITIGGRPISKIVAGYVTGVIIDGLAIIIDVASKDFNMSGGAWTTLIIGTFGPPTAAYLKRFSTRDASQVIQAVPTDILRSELNLKSKSPY